MQTGVDAFIQNMAELGFEATLEAELVIYTVEAVDGAYAGRPVVTGVGVGELAPWPQVPPHWLHFPRSLSEKQCSKRYASLVECKDAIYSTTKSRLL